MTNDTPNDLLYQRVLALVSESEITRSQYEILVRRDQSDLDGRVYLQIRCWREDTFHPGDYDWGYGGKAYLSPHAVDSEIVQTIFGLYKAYDEHECRETFLWRGVRIFGPHIDIRWLHEAAQYIDARPAPTKERTQDDGDARPTQEAARQGGADGDADAHLVPGEGGARPAGVASGVGEAAVVELSIPDSWKARPPRLEVDSDAEKQAH